MLNCITSLFQGRITFFFVVFLCSYTTSQSYSQSITTEQETDARRAEELFWIIKPLLMQSLTGEYPSRAAEVQFSVDRSDLTTQIYANKADGPRRVVFSLGAVRALHSLNRSFAGVFCCHPGSPTHGSLRAQASLWGSHVLSESFHTQSYVENGTVQSLSNLGEKIARRPSYCLKIRSDRYDCSVLETQPEYVSRFNDAELASYTMIMGHELAHHLFLQVHGDKYFNQPGNEANADRWGLYFVGATGRNFVAAINGLILLWSVEAYGESSNPIYPEATCRIRDALSSPQAKKIVEPKFKLHPATYDDQIRFEAFSIKDDLMELAQRSCH